jgi:TRAP-type C4-dicarboxylate transport system permease small subunit
MKIKIESFLGKVLVVIMALMVLNVLWQVFSRYVLGSPSPFTEELARYLMIWIGILGAAYASGKKMHVAIDILPSKANPGSQKLLRKLVACCVMVFALTAMVVGGLRLVYLSYLLGQTSPALQIPLAVVYSVIPVSGLLIVYFKSIDLLNA